MKSQDTKLTQAPRDKWAEFDALTDDEIDTSDIPETRDWSGAVRGLFHMSPDERRKAIEKLRRKRVVDIHTNGSDLDDLPTSGTSSEHTLRKATNNG
jgi:hypothetical protein